MEPRPLPDRLKLNLDFSPVLLQQDLARLAEAATDWTDHFVKTNYQGNWSVVPLRANRGAVHPIQQIYSDPNSRDYVDTPYLDYCPYLQEVLAGFKTTVYAARLMRLGTGSVIKEHRDYDLDAAGECIRLHIPVVTNPEVHFLLNHERVIMDAGTCWYLRLSDPHSVRNEGPDRIHLVIDLAVNPWVQEQLAAAAQLV